MDNNATVSFMLGGLHFEYDTEKQKRNLEKHGISFRTAARVFLMRIISRHMMRNTLITRIVMM